MGNDPNLVHWMGRVMVRTVESERIDLSNGWYAELHNETWNEPGPSRG